jgi:hypothetical protein
MAKKKDKIVKQKADGKQFKAGSKTKGTTIGTPREVAAEKIGDAKQVESTKIADQNLVTAEKLRDVKNVEAAQIGDIREIEGQKVDETRSDEFRAKQLSLAQALEKQMNGEGPSLAGIQFQQDTDRAIKQQMAFAASNRNVNRALSGRQAMQNQAQLSQNAAQESAKQRFAEQLAAQQQLGTVVGQGREQDLNVAMANAGFSQQANVSNQSAFNQALITQAGLNQQANLANQDAYNNQSIVQANLNQNANLSNQGALNTASLNQASLDQNANLANAQAVNDFLKSQAGLNQQASIANQGAFNQATISQAQINSAIEQQRISAAATVNAANASASAARYGVDASNYRFQQELAFEMDKYYQGAQSGVVDANQAGQNAAAKQLAEQAKRRDDQIASAGSAMTQSSVPAGK